MTNWNTYKLGELYNVASGLSKSREEFGFGHPFVTFKDVFYNFFLPAELTSLANTTEKEIKSCSVKKGDIFLTRTSETMHELGMSAVALKDYENATFNGFTKRLRLKENVKVEIDPVFIGYYLRSAYIRNQISMHASMTTRASLNSTAINSIEITIPDIDVQVKIGKILKALDDKIQLNRRMNNTLEQMAQTLFRHYFVDDINEDNLPEGWRVGKLDYIINIKHGYAFKGEFFSDDPTENLLLTPGNFKIGGGFSYSKFKYYNGQIPKDYILNAGDLLVTMTDLSKDGDTLGYAALVPTIPSKLLLHNQRLGKIDYKSNLPYKFYLYWLMRTDKYRSFVLGGATGTTVKHTSPSRILDFSCVIPNIKVLAKFEEVASGLYEKELSNNLEIHSLSQIRDSLLPKLMSGEIDVIEAQDIALHEPVLS